jgi:hypothetical protein
MSKPRNGKAYIAARKRAKRVAAVNHSAPIKIIYSRPIPVEKRGSMKFHHFYPFEDMKPGGSFWIQSDEKLMCPRAAVSQFAKKSGWKFITRGQSKDGRPNKEVHRLGERGVRIWRIS